MHLFQKGEKDEKYFMEREKDKMIFVEKFNKMVRCQCNRTYAYFSVQVEQYNKGCVVWEILKKEHQ